MDVGSPMVLGLAELAAGQWGLFTTAQAREVGLNGQQVARLAGAGAIERLQHSVYRIGGTPADYRDDLRATWLAFNPKVTVAERLCARQVEVVSHRSAARLRGLGDAAADILEFTAPERKQSRRSDVRVHRRPIAETEWTILDGLPVTTSATTIRDLAAGHLDSGHLAGVVRDALTTEHLDLREVEEALRPYAPRYGATSEQLIRRLLLESGVPRSTTQVAQVVMSAESVFANRASIDADVLAELLPKILTPALAEALTTILADSRDDNLAVSADIAKNLLSIGNLDRLAKIVAEHLTQALQRELPQPVGSVIDSPPDFTSHLTESRQAIVYDQYEDGHGRNTVDDPAARCDSAQHLGPHKEKG